MPFQKGNKLQLRHGHAGRGKPTPTFNSWANMVQRCTNPKASYYEYYGGRGIKVCERWKIFANFLADMGERPDGKTLDRFPNKNGYYEQGNCRWATNSQQRLNSRNPNRGGKPTIDIAGKKFSRLTVVSFLEARKGQGYWDCTCDCGNKSAVSRKNLLAGLVRSCGCSRQVKKGELHCQ